jgi:hypothetical protein
LPFLLKPNKLWQYEPFIKREFENKKRKIIASYEVKRSIVENIGNKK